jgi:uncharacterized protein YecT (DUF1311 family)
VREPQRREDVPTPVQRTNWTTIALIGGLVLLVLIVAYFATRRDSDQDKLTSTNVATGSLTGPSREKLCASTTTYDLIKRELFRRAAQVRGSDQAAFDKLSGAAVVRMENPVMENQDTSTGAVNCSGSLALDLPPGVAVIGGRRTLTSNVDYTVTVAADGSGPVVLLRNADAIITPLATLAQVNQPASGQQQTTENSDVTAEGDLISAQPTQPPQPAAAAPQAGPSAPPRPASARPSFDCSKARTRGELTVCNEAGLAALDRQMAAQYSHAFAAASPEEREILRDTARRFYAYRDRCPNTACIGDAYTGRMREIRDIMEGRWQPSQ